MNSKGCIIWAIALLSIMILACRMTLLRVGWFLTTTDTLSQADAIVVLSGDNDEFVRAQHGIRLFHQGYAPNVIFISDFSEFADLPCSPVQHLREIARRQGLPANAAIITNGSQSTYDDATQTHNLAQQHHWRSLIIVTDLFHTRRAGRTFRTLLPDTTIYVSAAPDPDYNAEQWWQTENSLVSVFNELIKLTFYWARYGIAPVG